MIQYQIFMDCVNKNGPMPNSDSICSITLVDYSVAAFTRDHAPVNHAGQGWSLQRLELVGFFSGQRSSDTASVEVTASTWRAQ